MMPDINCSGKI